MLCAGEMVATTSSIPDTFFSQNYEAVNEGRQADPDTIQAIRDDFFVVLQLSHNSELREEIARHGGPNGKATSLVRALIQNGGYASPDTFEAQIQKQVNKMLTALNAEMRYDLWGVYVREYSEALKPLMEAADDVSPDVGRIQDSAERLKVMTEQSRILGNILDEQLKRDRLRLVVRQIFSPNVIIALQNDQIQELYPLVINIIEAAKNYDPDIWSNEKEDLFHALERFRTALHEFNNPFTILRNLQEYLSNHPTNIELGLGDWHSFFRSNPLLNETHPHLIPEQPHKLRRMISNIMLAAAKIGKIKDPLEINFSWDKDTNTLSIEFKNYIVSGGSVWEEIAEALNDFTAPWSWHVRQTYISGETISVQVPTLENALPIRQPQEENIERSVVLRTPAPVRALARAGNVRTSTPYPCLYDAMVIGASIYTPRRIHPRANTFIGGLPFAPSTNKPLLW